jgi:hypothetical protein
MRCGLNRLTEDDPGDLQDTRIRDENDIRLFLKQDMIVVRSDLHITQDLDNSAPGRIGFEETR